MRFSVEILCEIDERVFLEDGTFSDTLSKSSYFKPSLKIRGKKKSYDIKLKL